MKSSFGVNSIIKIKNDNRNPEYYAIPYIEVEYHMRDDYIINGWFIKGIENKIIIIFHNLNANRAKYLSLVKWIYNSGWGAYICDLRGHGKNEKYNQMFVHNLLLDGVEIIEKTYQNFLDSNSLIVLYGFSLGANIAAYNLNNKRINGVILDSGPIMKPCRAFGKMLARVEENKLNLIQYKRYVKEFGILRQDIKLIKHNFRKCSHPILIIHGKKDEFVNWQETKKVFDSISGIRKDYILIEKAHHLTNMSVDSVRYYKEVSVFLENVGSALYQES